MHSMSRKRESETESGKRMSAQFCAVRLRVEGRLNTVQEVLGKKNLQLIVLEKNMADECKLFLENFLKRIRPFVTDDNLEAIKNSINASEKRSSRFFIPSKE